MAKATDKVSVREFSRRMGVSDTAVRNEIYDKKTNPNGCLRAGVGTKNAGSKTRPTIDFQVAYAEWLKAGRTIKNPDYYPKGDATAQENMAALQEQIKENSISNIQAQDGFVPDKTNTNRNYLGYESLLKPGMNSFEAESVKAIYDAGIKELAYMKAMGVLVPVDRVRTVLFEHGKMIKEALLQMPSRIASHVRNAANDREAMDIMYTEMEAILLTISKGPSASMSEDAKDELDDEPFEG